MHKNSQKDTHGKGKPKGQTKVARKEFVNKVIGSIDLKILPHTPFRAQCTHEHYQ